MASGANDLKEIARRIRVLSLKAIAGAGSGHPGGCLSVADILAVLYFKIARPQPYDPADPERDVIILSKGHSAPALYACWSLLKTTDWPTERDLLTLRQLDSPLQGHPSGAWAAWAETSTGSLGQGCSFAVGLALAFKRTGSDRRVFCILGDGDLQEGIVAESARIAGHYNLDNLTFLCDRNRKTSDAHSIDPVRDAVAEFSAYGWWAERADGHDLAAMVRFLRFAGGREGRPLFLECETIKGKGVPFIEDDPAGYHGSLALSDKELKESLEQLG